MGGIWNSFDTEGVVGISFAHTKRVPQMLLHVKWCRNDAKNNFQDGIAQQGDGNELEADG